MKPLRRSGYMPPVLTLAVSGFLGLIAIFALDEYWDLPARSFGIDLKPIRPSDFSLKVAVALVLFVLVLGVLRQAIHRINHLSDMLTLCAWCRRVSLNGDWISIDHFLQQRRNTSSSVGLCPDCYGRRVKADPEPKLRAS